MLQIVPSDPWRQPMGKAEKVNSLKRPFAMPEDWSKEEVELAVSDYLDMLDVELRGQPYSKAEHRRTLQPLLRNRSEGSIEFKHQNISAALIAAGYPYIPGYKPRWNYQRALLDDVLQAQLLSRPDLISLIQSDAVRAVPVPEIDDIFKVLTEPPENTGRHEHLREPGRIYGPINYLEREARNRELGLSGEVFVVNYERARLSLLNKEVLASRIQHISRDAGDGAGFDILSFEESGAERLIEVKTTKYGSETPFFLSRNEVSVSETRASQYHLYRLYAFGPRPRLFTLAGALSSTCALEPTAYLGSAA